MSSRRVWTIRFSVLINYACTGLNAVECNSLTMLDLPNKPVHELTNEEMVKVDQAEGTLNDQQWSLFQHFLERGRGVREAFQKVRERSRKMI